MALTVGELVGYLKINKSDWNVGLSSAKAEWRQFGAQTGKDATAHKASFDQVGRAALGVGVAAAAGVISFTRASMGFEKQMSGVKSVSGATKEQMDQLGAAAMAAGADVELAGVTAGTAAQAEMELVKAGVAVSDILGGALKGSLSLAVAGQLDVAQAAEIASQSMNIFNLKGNEVGHVADVMAAAANKTNADVRGLGDSLRQGGLVAAQTGAELEETVATLAAFADEALIGSDAGTSLKTMLQRLTPQSAEAAALMKELGFTAFDAKGEFVGMAELAGRLQDALGGMSTEQRNAAMNTLFGSDAVRGATVLMKYGEQGIRDLTAAVDDQGAAQRMAAEQTNNLAGDLEALGGAWETLSIKMGGTGTGPMRSAVRGLTGVVTAVSELPPAARTGATAFATITAAAGTLGGGFLILAPRIMETKRAMEALRETSGLAGVLSRGLKPALGVVTVALAAGATALFLWQQRKEQAARATEDYVSALEADSGAIKGNVREMAAQRLEQAGALALAEKLDINLRTLTNATLGNADAQAKVNARLAEFQEAGLAPTAEYVEMQRASFDLQAALDGEAGYLKNAQVAHERQAAAVGASGDAADGAAAATRRHAKAQEEATGPTMALADAVDILADRFDEAERRAFSVEEASDAFRAAMDELRGAVEEGGKSLRGNTDEGRANREMLRDLVAKANDHAEAVFEETGSVKEAVEVARSHKSRLEEVAGQLGLNKEKVEGYSGVIRTTPKQWTTRFSANTDAAEKAADELREKLDAMSGHKWDVELRVRLGNMNAVGDGLGDISAGGGSAASMAATALSVFDGNYVSSGFRPGATTASGNPSLHADAANPAQDIAPGSHGMFDFLKQIYGSGIREMIFGHRIFKNGLEGFWAPDDHLDHLHLAEKGLVADRPMLAMIGESTKARRGGGEVVAPAGLIGDVVRAELAAAGGGGPLIGQVMVAEWDVFTEHKLVSAIDKAKDQSRFRARAGR